jgi:hypothetical protein
MTIAEFRAACEVAGRFASFRERKEPGPKNTSSHKHNVYPIVWEVDEEGQPVEHRPALFVCKGCTKVWRAGDIGKAYDPSDVILLQASGGTLKFVAGTADSTIIINAGPTQAQGKALVSARLLLNAAKSLRGRGEVAISVNGGALITLSTGGEIALPNADDALPKWLRPNRFDPAWPFPAKFWSEAAKVFGATTGNVWPYSLVGVRANRDGMYLASTDKYSRANYRLGGPAIEAAGLEGSISSVFTSALRDIEEPGVIRIGDGNFTIETKSYTAVTQFYPAYGIPSVEGLEHDTTVNVDKRVLTDMVKGVASNDEFNRVALAAHGNTLTVHPWANRNASVKVPAEVQGRDTTVGVDAAVLSRVLMAYPGKAVSLGMSAGPTPITLLDKEWPWEVSIAPVM